jgi:hypothetical protein
VRHSALPRFLLIRGGGARDESADREKKLRRPWLRPFDASQGRGVRVVHGVVVGWIVWAAVDVLAHRHVVLLESASRQPLP